VKSCVLLLFFAGANYAKFFDNSIETEFFVRDNRKKINHKSSYSVFKKNRLRPGILVNSAVVLFIALLVIPACTSHKKQGELSGFGQFYQNMTAYYNGYFNANELYQESIRNIENDFQDNYNEVLAIFPYQASEDVRSEYGNLDLAMEKVSKVVALRRASDWTDQCYLMLAKCQYVKKDYESAEKTLQYLVHHFEPTREVDPRRVSETRSRTAYNREREINRERTRRQIERERRQARRDAERERRQARREAERERERAQRERERQREEARERRIQERESGQERETETQVEQDTTRTEIARESTGETTEEPRGRENRISARHGASGTGDRVEQDGRDRSTAGRQDEADYKSTGLLGGEHAYDEAKIWMAKNLIERDAYSRALNILREVHQKTGLDNELRALAYLTEAHLEISRGNHERAIEPLENAIPLTRNRQNRARYSYILGQLYQREHNYRTAGGHFENAARWTNDFEMEFNANLNTALAGQRSIQGSIRELERLAGERKNTDFRDRIYYTMGRLYYQEGHKADALEALETALEYRSDNQNQIREIYYLMATIQLEKEDYLAAHKSFSQLQPLMPERDERYREVNRLAESLGEIAQYYEQLEINDTLLYVADLPEDQQRKWAERQFARDREEQETMLAVAGDQTGTAQRQDGVALRPGGQRATPGGARGGAQRESNFFAYDDRQLRRGAREFERRWGNRELADDWRRSNSPFYRAETDEDFARSEEVPERIVPESQIEEYLALLPHKDADKARVKQNIIDALFHLGVLFREKLENYRVSAEHLERLKNEFPRSNKELEGMYVLYLDYRDMGMEAEKTQIKNEIIARFPDSRHARVLEDPANAAALMEEENRLPNYYRSIVEFFEQGDFEEVQKRIARSRELFGTDHKLSPRLALMNAMSLGNMVGREAYISGLEDLIAQHPNTPEETRAREILRFLKGDATAFDSYSGDVDLDKFQLEDDRMHYVIVVINNPDDVTLNDAQISIANFNQKYYQLSGLRISNHILDTDRGIPMILIRSFNNKTQSMRYLTDAKSLQDEFLPAGAQYEIYPITQRNYREVLRERSTQSYRLFYEKHYKR